MTNIDASILRLLLRYEADSGRLFWLPRPASMFSAARDAVRWNGRRANTEALTALDSKGYRQGLILGRTQKAHRVAWTLATGAWPESQIDHINGNRDDNRLSNLREATPAQNSMNRRTRLGSSRFLGVHWCKSASAWRAQIKIDGKNSSLGFFASESDAAHEYDRAARLHHGEFANLNFPQKGNQDAHV